MPLAHDHSASPPQYHQNYPAMYFLWKLPSLLLAVLPLMRKQTDNLLTVVRKRFMSDYNKRVHNTLVFEIDEVLLLTEHHLEGKGTGRSARMDPHATS